MKSTAVHDLQPLPESLAMLFGTDHGRGKCVAVTWAYWREHYHEETDNLVKDILPVAGGSEFAVWEDRFSGNVIVERKHPSKAYYFAGKEHMKRLV